MRIAIVGAGGVGGGFGAALAHAGADVSFIARGAHLAAMQKDGLRVESVRGDTHLKPAKATDDPKTVGPVDYVLFCVKLWDVESAGEMIRPMMDFFMMFRAWGSTCPDYKTGAVTRIATPVKGGPAAMPPQFDSLMVLPPAAWIGRAFMGYMRENSSSCSSVA